MTGSASRGRCGSARSSAWRARRRSDFIAGRLRVVDDDHVPVALEALRVHRVVGLEDLPLLVGDRLRVALERVVHQLRDVEELLAAEDHLPVRVEPDVAHQRHQRVEDLRDAAAERGRADVQDALALQGLGELADLARSARGRRCACSRRATCGRGRPPEARAADPSSAAHGLALVRERPPRDLLGRSPSVTSSCCASPSRMMSSVTSSPGSSSEMIRGRSALLVDLLAVDGGDHVAAGRDLAGPGSGSCRRRLSPASSAGPPADDLARPARRCRRRGRARSASCG